MTLKEKFGELSIDNVESKCEKIADEFAIGFAEWCQYRCVQKEDLISQLQIYKKEKGL